MRKGIIDGFSRVAVCAVLVAATGIALAITERQQVLWTGAITDSANPGKEFASFDDAAAALRVTFLAEVAEPAYAGWEWKIAVQRMTAVPNATQTWYVHRKLGTLDGAGYDAAVAIVKGYYLTHSGANPPSAFSPYQVQLTGTAPY